MNVCQLVNDRSFEIIGASYIGAPRSNTMMFITKKVEHLLSALDKVENCLVFAEIGICVSRELSEKHAFIFSDKPQLEYAEFANIFEEKRLEEEKKLHFRLTNEGYYVSNDVIIPSDAYIEPGCVIGPDVKIGNNAKIYSGAVIRRATIGNGFIANEYAAIGTKGFTMTEDAEGNKIRIPTLGRVVIGNNVEIGAHDNISCGSAGDTALNDNVKLDSLVHIGHDVQLKKNVEVTAGVTVGGFVNVEEGTFVGIGSAIRNRITIGEKCFIGMGSCVTKSIAANAIVIGNPAKSFNFAK